MTVEFRQEQLPFEVWSEDDLIVAFQPGQNDILAVSFPSYGTLDPAKPPLPARFGLVVGGEGRNNVLYMTDMSWSWMSRTDLRERALGYIRKAAEICGAKKIFAFGNSAGGTSALHLNADAGFDGILACAPQIDLGLAFEVFDRRHHNWRGPLPEDFELCNLAEGFAAGGRIVLLHGLKGPDAAHAALCPAAPDLAHYLFPDSGHDVRNRLKPFNTLPRVFDALVAGYPDQQIDALMTEAGGLRRGQLNYNRADYDWKRAGNAPAKAAEEVE